MKNSFTISIILALIVLSSSIYSQVLFSDDFESGVPSEQWGLFWDGEEAIEAKAMNDAPAPLENGGSYVGFIQDSDNSFTGAAQAIAGDESMQDYSIEGDVYCYTNHPSGSAYTGLVIYADSSVNTYIKLVADFDGNQRLRLYNNKLNTTTFQYTFAHTFEAGDVQGGIPTEDGWHNMKVEVKTISEDTTAFWCYFDGELLAGCPIYDTSEDVMNSGKYGVFSFSQGSGEGLPGYFDNVVVKALPEEGAFADDFESGAPKEDWGLFWGGEESLTAVEMSNAPVALPSGGSYIGFVQDLDNSYTGAAQAIAGDESMQDYSIEGDVYCYTNHPSGSAYTGLVIYADSSVNTYIKLVADFDGNQRLRLYNNKLNTTTFQYTFAHTFEAGDVQGGIPTEDGWHNMKVEVKTISEDTTAFWCYFDGELLAGCPIYDTSEDVMNSGKYGVFSFSQGSGEGLPGYFDNILVKPLETVVSVEEEKLLELQPQEFALNQNYPNPFNPTTNISYQLQNSSSVSLVIYDVLGRKIKTLVSEQQSPGYYSVMWNGRNEIGTKVNSGVYVYTLKAGQLLESRKMLLMK